MSCKEFVFLRLVGGVGGGEVIFLGKFLKVCLVVRYFEGLISEFVVGRDRGR